MSSSLSVLPMKLWESNVFPGVCLFTSVHRGRGR